MAQKKYYEINAVIFANVLNKIQVRADKKYNIIDYKVLSQMIL